MSSPDNGIKKVIVPRASLPPVDKDGKYLVRYRIASVDKNRYSHWSPIYKVSGKSVIIVNGSVQKLGNIVMVAWQSDSDISLYDIFIKYNGDNNYSYHGSSNSNNYSIVVTSGKISADIVVQLGGISKVYNNSNIIYSGNISLI